MNSALTIADKKEKKTLREAYFEKLNSIESRLTSFKNVSSKKYKDEFIFCILTPGSNAQRCWQAVQELKKLPNLNRISISNILKKRTRFHNNKTSYILENLRQWHKIQSMLFSNNIPELRNWLAENVHGYGLKESSHFLRNIGKSENQIAILDRHILKHLYQKGIIKSQEIKSKKHYLEIEKQFLNFAQSLSIPADHLDLLLWSQENGEVFK